jgi:hypothetical protein
MRLNVSRTLVILAALAAAGAVQAEVAMDGVLFTGSHQFGIDSADVRIDTVSLLVPTPGWAGAAMVQDTFRFPALVRWPTAVKVFYKTESTLVLAVSPVKRDSWYVMPGFGPVEPMLLLHEVSGIEESRPGQSGIAVLSVIPSVTSGSALICSELSPSASYQVEVYDTRGRRVRILAGAAGESGRVALSWQGDDESGRQLPEGIYYCRLVSEGTLSARKLVLTR